MPKPFSVTSISWIDQKNLPSLGNVGLITGLKALASWPTAVAIGLVATSNSTPPRKLQSVKAFKATKQYRSLLSFNYHEGSVSPVAKPDLDPGYTPKTDTSKLPPALALGMPNHEASPGEKSNLSSVVAGRLHPCSGLGPLLPAGSEVLASGLIKFRAGQDTDKIGIDKAGSPYHVPWVWCETLLYRDKGKFWLLGRGSSFPSHGWYINGQQVGYILQKAVTATTSDPALSTGPKENQPITNKDNDRSKGRVVDHDYAIPAGLIVRADLTNFI